MPEICHYQPLLLCHALCSTYACVYHEAQDILYAVESQNTSVDPFPHRLVIRIATLYCCSQLVYIFRIGDGNLKESCFLVPLEAEEVLAHYKLHRLYSRLVLSELCVEVGFKAFAIRLTEGDGGGDVKVMEKACDM